jgi:hypothetical protein
MNSRQWLGGRPSISPGENELRLPHQPFNQQAAEQLGLNPGPAGDRIVFGQAAQAQQTLEVFEAQFDLP